MALTRVTTHGIEDGGVHSSDIANDAVTADKLANDAVTADKLSNTGVTAGSYGSSSAIPSLTIDAQGRVTAASTTSIDSTSIANGTSNVSVAASGDITLTRAGATTITVTGDGARLPNGKRMGFGNGDDLRIYHDGVDSYIDDAGTGNLRLNGNEVHILSNDNSEYGGRFISNGAVELYHDGNKKFETKSSGVSVFGEASCNNLVVGSTADINGQLSVNRVLVRDDGAASPVFNIRTDDDAPWAFTLGNDSYSGSHEHGLRMYQAADGSVNIRNSGNNNWERINFQQQNGGSSETNIQIGTNRSVSLMYQGSTKLNTKSDGVLVSGELECTTLDVNGASNFSGVPVFQSNVGIGNTTVGNSFANGKALALGDNDTGIRQNGDGILELWSNNAQMMRIRNGGDGNQSYNHFRPSSNNAYDLGSTNLRWRNIYTNDLNLSNEGSSNDVDGTWGNWTIQEGEDDLFLLNRRNGKKYKFNLTEVN